MPFAQTAYSNSTLTKTTLRPLQTAYCVTRPIQRTRNDSRTCLILATTAKPGHTQYLLYRYYVEDEDGLEKNVKMAMEWLNQVAEMGTVELSFMSMATNNSVYLHQRKRKSTSSLLEFLKDATKCFLPLECRHKIEQHKGSPI